MIFKIPFTFSKLEAQKKRPKFFLRKIKYKKKTKLEGYLKNSGVDLTREEYLAIVYRALVINFVFLFIIANTVLFILGVHKFYLYGGILALMFSLFVFFSQRVYPKIYVSRRQRNIEKNLMNGLEDMMVQLDSGIPLFSVMVNISDSNYGVLSIEFKKAVKRINAGESEEEVLDDLTKKNPSIFFRRTLWQISNGMKTGSEMAIVVRNSIKALNEEQLIQIQDYGNKLNPLIMFYMLVSVIVPALSVAFLTILASMLNLEKRVAMMMFGGLFIFVVLVQIMFLGMIRSRRPSLL